MSDGVTEWTHLSHVLLDQLGADDADEAGICAVGHGAGTQGLTRARRPEQQNTLRRLDAQVHKALRLGEEERRLSRE